MRKIILYIASSLDGCIARKDHSIDWLFMDGDYGFNEFEETVDIFLMGRKTYDVSLTLAEEPFRKTTYVFSKQKSGNEKNINFINKDIISFTRELQQQDGKNIWLIGGGEIIRLFLNEKLIDELIVAIHPVLLGDGILLFPPGFPEQKLKLLKEKVYENGLLHLFYEVLK